MGPVSAAFQAGRLCQAHSRLLGQSCRLQSLGAIEVRPGTPDPATPKVEDVRYRRIDLSTAAFSTSLHPSQHEDPVAEIAELLGDRLHLLPGLVNIREVPFDPLASLVAAAALIGPRQSRPPLVVRGRELDEESVDITPVVGAGRSLGNLHFVSGHRSEYP
jgi:hypothetical protein